MHMKRALLILFTLLLMNQLHATHIAGGAIEVRCLGGNTFEITLIKYRDIVGVNYMPTATVTVDPMGAGTSTSYTVTRQSITALQPPITNPCLIPPPNTGIEAHVYTGQVTMNNGTAYYIYHEDATRPLNLLNVVNSGNQGSTVYAEFPDPGVYGCNNSPTFDVGPPLSVCLNEPLVYDNSATDIDGDQLEYRFCEAYNGNNQPPFFAPPPFPSIPYQPPYTAQNPVSANPQLSIDQNTGMVTGTPNLSGKWVFTVCVDEFRNGVKIGEYRRDVQMTVTTCNAPNPVTITPDYTSLALNVDVKASCDDSTVSFTSSNANAFSYSWDFGVPGINTDTSSQQSPTYTYPDTGTFTATLITNKGFICADTAEITVVVYPFMFPGFTFSDPQCVNQPIQFTDTSSWTYGTTFNWSWSFGAVGVQPSGSPSVARSYSNAGTYNVSLTVESSKGCRAQAVEPVQVFNRPTVNAGPPALIVCAGDSVTLPATASGATSYDWTVVSGPGGLTCDTCLQPKAFPASTTVYSLTAFGPGGCSRGDLITVSVQPAPVISAGPDQFLCGTGSVQLNAQLISSPGGVVWSWSPTTGLSQPNIPNPTANPSTSTTYVVTATNPASGCSDSDTVTVFLNSVSVTAGQNQVICPGDTTTITSSTPVANATYSWTPATNISDPTSSNPDVWPNVTTTYTLTITDPVSGCSGTDSVLVTVNNPPPISAGPDTTICEGTTAQLNASGASSYQWVADPSLSQTNIPNPTANPAVTTTYTVIGADAAGCTAEDQVTVNVVAPAAISTSGDATLCIGDTTTLSASGGVAYSWTPTGSLSGATTANPTAFPTSTTTYSLTVEDGNGCFIDTSLTITIAPLPTINAGADVSICFGDTTQLSASGGNTYNWSPAGSLSNPNIANPLAYPTANTTYTVVGTDVNGCSNVDSVNVVVNTLANGTFSSDTAICIGESVTLSASGFSQYQWKPGNSLSCTNCATTVATPTGTTNYTVVVTDQNGCTDSGTVRVTVNQLPVVVMGSDQTICVGDSARISANISNAQGYSWAPGASLSDPNIRDPWAKPTTTTTYTVTATDNNGCSNTNTVTVNVNPLPTITTSFSSITICEGDTAQLSASGGVSYSWSPGATLSCTNCPDPIASPLLNTVYTVEVTDANGCVNRDSVTVNVNVLQPGNFIADTAICIGESVTLFANGFTSYNWFPNVNLSCTTCPSPVATPTTTTTYFAAVEDANGCKDTGSVEITVNPLPTPTVSVGDDSICIGSATNLVASGGVQYDWSPTTGLSDPQIANPIASPTVTTNYVVTVTDVNGCQNTAAQNITVLPLPTVGVSSASPYVCKYDSTQLNATGGVAYQWSPGASLTCTTCPNPEAFPLVTTMYTVEVTDQYGCVNEDSIEILVNSAAGNISPDTAICIGGAANLQIGGGVSYLWYPGTDLSCTACPNPVATPTSTITYNVEVTDANGCRDTADVTVTVNPLPIVNAGQDVTICENDDTQLNAVSPTATSFNWLPTVGLSNPNIANPIASPPTTTTYVVTVEDANTCQNTDDVTVTVNQRPNTNAGNDVAICQGDTTALQATGAVSYVWSPAAGLSCVNCPGPLANPTSTTTYTVVGTAANGCTQEDEVTVTVNSLPTISVTPSSTICIGDDIQLLASGGVSYQWLPATDLSCTNCPNPIATPDTTITYTVTAFNAAGCFDVDSTTITVASPAAVTVSADTTVCPDETVQLNASGGVTYNWNPTNNDMVGANTATPTLTVTENQVYTLTVIDVNGCEIIETVDIGVFVPAEPMATGTDTICFGESVVLGASNGVTYSWSPDNSVSDPTIADPTATPDVTTIYTIEIIDANGCPNSDEVKVTVIQLPNVDAGPDISLYSSSRAVLEATGAVSYVWSPNIWIQDTSSARTFIYPEDSITYYVVGTDAFGCQNLDSVNVFVLPSPKYFVPNAFTPNGDGQNDLFRISYYENFVLETLQVFNRWGQLVFSTEDITQAWDGRAPNGDPLPTGAYIYIINGTDEIGAPLYRQGNVTLMR